MQVACIQLTSGGDIPKNIARVQQLVSHAASGGAQFIATPENTFFMGEGAPKYTQAEHPGALAAAEMAKLHKVWLLIGSVAVLPSLRAQRSNPENPDRIASSPAAPRNDVKTVNRSLLFNPNGDIVTHYDKIHLFDVEVGDGQSYRESAKFAPGREAVLAATPFAQIGMTVCYDVRFPQLYRALAKRGAEILAVPSAFTKVTGEAHWHVLLRARAIENGCFVIAPAQCGTHPGGRETFGHSLIVDPWGKILADGGTEEGVVTAEINLEEVKKARARIPSLQHDRDFDLR